MTTEQQPQDRYLGLVVAGWVLAIYLPVGGIIAGLFLITRRPGHGIGVLALSMLWFVVAALIVGWFYFSLSDA